MTRYEILLFLHILGAIVWVGLGMTGHALMVIADRKGEWRFAASLQRAFKSIEAPSGVFGPLLLLGSGIGMVVDGPWAFTDLWVAVGLAGFGVALVLGVAFQGPGLRRYETLARDRGPDDSATIAVGRRLNALMWPELAILVVVVLAMTTKPVGAGSVSFWVTAGAIAAVGLGLMLFGMRAVDRPARAARPEGGPS